MTAEKRAPVSVAAIVAAARTLLVDGGIERVTMREIARRLSVQPPALYKHVADRADVLDLLSRSLLDELVDEVVAAREAVPQDDLRERLFASGFAWHTWAHRRPAEQALLFATPAAALAHAPMRRTFEGQVELARAYTATLFAAAASDRLARRPLDSLPLTVQQQLTVWADSRDFPIEPDHYWAVVRGYHDLMGLVMVESLGQVAYAISESDEYIEERLRSLASQLIIG
jgi:AcrR family transcriptional regulator